MSAFLLTSEGYCELRVLKIDTKRLFEHLQVRWNGVNTGSQMEDQSGLKAGLDCARGSLVDGRRKENSYPEGKSAVASPHHPTMIWGIWNSHLVCFVSIAA